MKIKSLLLLMFLALISPAFSQNSTEKTLNEKYWVFRDRFRKFYTSIGSDQGQSLVIDRIHAHKLCHSSVGLINYGDVMAYMAEYLGVLSTELYLLNQSSKKDLVAIKATENELYFAINAISRCDNFAEIYYSSTGSNNGFFVRTDVPQGFYRKWELLGDIIKVQHSDCSAGRQIDYSKTSGGNFFAHDGVQIDMSLSGGDECKMVGYSETANGSIIGYGRNVNEMSVDQLIGILFGFKNIITFVNPNLNVDPDGNGSLPNKNIHSWVKELTNLMMNHISEEDRNIRIYDEEADEKMEEKRKEHPSYFWKKNFNLFRKGNYIITNPTVSDDINDMVYRGPFAFGFGYTIEKIAEEITGEDYPGTSMHLSVGLQVFRYALDALGIYFYTKEILHAYKSLNYATKAGALPYQTAKIAGTSKIGWLGLEMISPDLWSLTTLGMPLVTSSPEFWKRLYNYIPQNEKILNVMSKSPGAGMFVWIPPASNTWTHEQYYSMTDHFDVEWAELIYAVLNDSRPLGDPDDYQYWLTQAPCEGIKSETDQAANAPFNKMDIFTDIKDNYYPEGGNPGTAWNGESTPGDGDNRNFFNGLDYMLLYNYYRIASLKYFTKLHSGVTDHNWNFGNSFNDYRDIKCPCKSSDRFYVDRNINGTHVTSLTSLKDDLPFRFPDYKALNIRIPEWLTHDFSINSGGELRPNGDLSVCNSTLTINSSGKLATSENTNESYYKIITIGKNAVLDIKSNGALVVENNTMVLVEEGAKIIYNSGARIILNGPNAVLKFDQGGQLFLNSGAIFQIEDGDDGKGYVHFHSDWTSSADVPGIACQDKTAKFIISGTHNDKPNYYNDKKLQITGNVGLVTDWKLKHFIVEKCFVAMGKDSRISSNAEFTKFNKCEVNVLSNANQELYNRHNGICIPGRINSFNEVEINNCKTGIYYYNRGGQEVLNIDNCVIRNSIYGVDQIGGNHIIQNSTIGSLKGSIRTVGGTGFSKLRNNLLNIDIPAGFRPGTSCVYHFGSDNLYVWNNWIKNGGYGMQILDAKLRLKCNLLNENRMNLIWVRSPYVSLIEGYNQFASYSGSHIKGRGDTYFTLRDGYNIFEQPNNTYDQFLFDVIMSDRSPYTKWQFNGANNGYMSLTLNSYLDPDQNYRFQIFNYLNNTTHDLTLTTTPNLSSTIFTTRNMNCTEGNEYSTFNYQGNSYINVSNDYAGSVYTQLFSNPSRPLNVTNVKTTPSNNTPLGLVIQRNYNRMYDNSSNRVDSLISEIGKVLRLNSNRSDLKDSSNAKDMKIAYELYSSALSLTAFKANADSSINMFDKISAYYLKADSVYQSLWNQSKDTNSVWNVSKYQILVDWAQLNRMSNNKSKAIAILDSGKLFFEDSLHMDGLNMWRCLNQLESSLQSDTALSLDSAMANCQCFNKMYVNSDTVDLPETDTTVHYCDWENTPIGKESSYSFIDSSDDLQSIRSLNSDSILISKNDSGKYNLKNGSYSIIYSDSSGMDFRILNLNVIADTPTVSVSDSSIHICDWTKYRYSKKITFAPPHVSLPYISVSTIDNKDHSGNSYSIGEYRIDEYDTSNCQIYRTNLNVIGDSVELVSIGDTTIYTCTLDTTFNKINEIMAVDSLPIIVTLETGDSITYSINSATVTLNVDILDTLNCKVNRKRLTYVGSFPTQTNEDSVILICNSLDSANPSCIYYSHPSGSSSYIQRIFYNDSISSMDTVVYLDSCLMAGHYLVHVSDIANCNIKIVDLLIYDTLICGSSSIVILPNKFDGQWNERREQELLNKKLSTGSSSRKASVNLIKIYPNPVNTELSIESSSQPIRMIKLFNMQGICVKEFTFDGDIIKYTIDVNEFNSGNYLIQIVTTNDIYNNPVTIVH